MSAVLLANVFSDIGDWITEATDWLADFSANWWFVLIIFVVAAFITPSADIVNQTLMAAPMLVLYLVSIGIAWLCAPRESAQI